ARNRRRAQAGIAKWKEKSNWSITMMPLLLSTRTSMRSLPHYLTTIDPGVSTNEMSSLKIHISSLMEVSKSKRRSMSRERVETDSERRLKLISSLLRNSPMSF
ncbi:hypothetical protein PENTCL1PPCAC_23804, partial [Pristionchus entomophagus]